MLGWLELVEGWIWTNQTIKASGTLIDESVIHLYCKYKAISNQILLMLLHDESSALNSTY